MVPSPWPSSGRSAPQHPPHHLPGQPGHHLLAQPLLLRGQGRLWVAAVRRRPPGARRLVAERRVPRRTRAQAWSTGRRSTSRRSRRSTPANCPARRAPLVYDGVSWIDDRCRRHKPDPDPGGADARASTIAAVGGRLDPRCPHTSDLNMYSGSRSKGDVAFRPARRRAVSAARRQPLERVQLLGTSRLGSPLDVVLGVLRDGCDPTGARPVGADDAQHPRCGCALPRHPCVHPVWTTTNGTAMSRSSSSSPTACSPGTARPSTSSAGKCVERSVHAAPVSSRASGLGG